MAKKHSPYPLGKYCLKECPDFKKGKFDHAFNEENFSKIQIHDTNCQENCDAYKLYLFLTKKDKLLKKSIDSKLF